MTQSCSFFVALLHISKSLFLNNIKNAFIESRTISTACIATYDLTMLEFQLKKVL